MMTERDPQPPADVGQLRRPYSPLGSGELHGTRERRPWQAQPVPGATGMQDAPVERRVVGGDERRVVDPGAERRPQLAEGRRVVHVLPVQAVEVGERKLRGQPVREPWSTGAEIVGFTAAMRTRNRGGRSKHRGDRPRGVRPPSRRHRLVAHVASAFQTRCRPDGFDVLLLSISGAAPLLAEITMRSISSSVSVLPSRRRLRLTACH